MLVESILCTLLICLGQSYEKSQIHHQIAFTIHGEKISISHHSFRPEVNVALKGTLTFPSSIVVVAITSVCGGKEDGILVVMKIKIITIAIINPSFHTFQG